MERNLSYPVRMLTYSPPPSFSPKTFRQFPLAIPTNGFFWLFPSVAGVWNKEKKTPAAWHDCRI